MEIQKVKLNEEECLIAFDVTQLYTHIPLEEAIEMAAVKSYQVTDAVPVDIETFVSLTKLAS